MPSTGKSRETESRLLVAKAEFGRYGELIFNEYGVLLR